VAHASAALVACVALSSAPSPAQQTSPAPPEAAALPPSQPTPPSPEPAAPPAVEAPRLWALEVDLRGAWGFMVQPSPDHTGETSRRNGGPAVGGSVLFRTAYFLAPFLDVYFQPLYRSESVLDLGSLGPAQASRSLRTLGVVGGAGFDFWRLRLAAGIGAYQMQVHQTLNGRTMRTSEWDMSYLFSAGGFVWGWDRIRVGLESRLGIIVDGGTTFFSVGIVVAGDAVRW
jgi:hypothetical protein